jgi:hypothetical protein
MPHTIGSTGTSSTTRGPRRFTDGEFARVGIHVRDASAGIYGCNACGRGWAVNTPPRGRRLAVGWWHCPNGCNASA